MTFDHNGVIKSEDAIPFNFTLNYTFNISNTTLFASSSSPSITPTTKPSNKPSFAPSITQSNVPSFTLSNSPSVAPRDITNITSNPTEIPSISPTETIDMSSKNPDQFQPNINIKHTTKMSIIDVETVDGTTLLMATCYVGLDSFAKYLIEKEQCGATNEKLLFTSSEGYQDAVSLLLNNASISVVSRGGFTPLIGGCSGGSKMDENGRTNTPASFSTINNLWRLDYIDSAIDSKYKYENINIFILNESINNINYYKFDSNYNEQPTSEHGIHIAALVVGKTVGITQGSLNILMYDYPVSRYKYGASNFKLCQCNTYNNRRTLRLKEGNDRMHLLLLFMIKTFIPLRHLEVAITGVVTKEQVMEWFMLLLLMLFCTYSCFLSAKSQCICVM